MAGADKKLSELDPTTTVSGSYMEISIPDGAGGWISKKILHSNVIASLITQITTLQNFQNQSTQTIKIKSKSANFTQILGSDVMIESIDLIYVSGSTTVKVGSTSGANDIISGRTITSVKNSTNSLSDYFASATTLYFTLTGGGTIDVIINYRENYNS